MSYEKQNFQAGEILSAAQLNHMEDGITQLEKNTQQKFDDIGMELEDVKKYGADVQKGFAEAISEKGVETANTDSFETMIDNVHKIQSGFDAIVTSTQGYVISTNDMSDMDSVVTSTPGYVISTNTIQSSVYVKEVTNDDN